MFPRQTLEEARLPGEGGEGGNGCTPLSPLIEIHPSARGRGGRRGRGRAEASSRPRKAARFLSLVGCRMMMGKKARGMSDGSAPPFPPRQNLNPATTAAVCVDGEDGTAAVARTACAMGGEEWNGNGTVRDAFRSVVYFGPWNGEVGDREQTLGCANKKRSEKRRGRRRRMGGGSGIGRAMTRAEHLVSLRNRAVRHPFLQASTALAQRCIDDETLLLPADQRGVVAAAHEAATAAGVACGRWALSLLSSLFSLLSSLFSLLSLSSLSLSPLYRSIYLSIYSQQRLRRSKVRRESAGSRPGGRGKERKRRGGSDSWSISTATA